MGRRPNALILQWFERGPKLNDSSNRYPHTCKACGENFPKGRIDSLTNHLKKKCPAISEADRINAWLAFDGSSHASHRTQKIREAQTPDGPPVDLSEAQPSGSQVDLPMIERDWTALETLAEVSRQMDLSEKHDDRGISQAAPAPTSAAVDQPAFNGPGLPSPPEGAEYQHDGQQTFGRQGKCWRSCEHALEYHDINLLSDAEPFETHNLGKDGVIDEKLQAIFQSQSNTNPSVESNLSMAAAATARLHPSLLDPQLLSEDTAASIAGLAGSVAETTPTAGPPGTPSPHVSPPVSTAPEPQLSTEGVPFESPSQLIPAASPSQPWGEITYNSESYSPVATAGEVLQTSHPIAKGGFRLESGILNGSKARHSRARFDAARRKEVQEVRKMGACIRCRILRKMCSKGDPCDTCRKVLSPRVWRSGCVRTKFSEQLDLYSAGVQIVLAQSRINSLKSAMALQNNGVVIEAYHFTGYETRLELTVLQCGSPIDRPHIEGLHGIEEFAGNEIVMVDNDNQDVPAKVETYMRAVLPGYIDKEPSHFMRTTLQTACEIAEQTNDEILKKALELWGLIEILDRERQWTIRVKTDGKGTESHFIKEETDQEVFTTICLQLAAAAERRAAATSKHLLTGMQRVLQDSKVKVDFSMYFATLVLLNCVEKSTWAFKAWEQPNLRPLWPLEKDPSHFTQQGHIIADLLRMLLAIRRALPRTSCRESDGILVTEEQDLAVQAYFEMVNLKVADVKDKQEHPNFSPTDPRSFELLFCSTLLLPGFD